GDGRRPPGRLARRRRPRRRGGAGTGHDDRDRPARERRPVPTHGGDRYRGRGDPRGWHRVPHGRPRAAAPAGALRPRRRGGRRAGTRGVSHEGAVMSKTRLRIAGGVVYDPANDGGADGGIRDVCIEDGRIVAELPRDAPKLDARGMVVMAGGVDIHSHIAGSSVNQGRRLLPEEHAADPAPAPPLADPDAIPRSGTGGTIPTTFTTGYRYAALGYTTAMEAAVAPLAARQAHAELDDTPIIDAGLFTLLGNDDYLLRQIAAGEAATTLETMRALAGRRAHFTHVQFHSYGGERGKSWKSAAKEVIEHVNAHPEVSVDVGQVMFGPATTLTADAPVEYLLHASS